MLKSVAAFFFGQSDAKNGMSLSPNMKVRDGKNKGMDGAKLPRVKQKKTLNRATHFPFDPPFSTFKTRARLLRYSQLD